MRARCFTCSLERILLFCHGSLPLKPFEPFLFDPLDLPLKIATFNLTNREPRKNMLSWLKNIELDWNQIETVPYNFRSDAETLMEFIGNHMPGL